MAKMLLELITAETPILNLSHSTETSDEEKEKILDLNGTSRGVIKEYIKYMYYQNAYWYYFKKDKNNYEYPFYIIDELIGMFLSKKRELETLEYEIAKVNNTYGLASKNFKSDDYTYHTLSSLIGNPLDGNKYYNLELLKLACVDEENEKKLLQNIFKMLAIDIVMLQKDRCSINLQFQINKKTGELDIAPIYDFSNCSPRIILNSKKTWNLRNVLLDINENSIQWLLNNYTLFREELEFYLEQDLNFVWDEICLYYQFDQDTAAYERVKDYYKIKEDSVRKYIRQLI